VVAAVAPAALAAAVALAAPPAVTVHAAGAHPMRYHLALPAGWSADREWPVLVAIPDAGREFDANLRAFVAARGDRPYILVAPEVLTCGGARTRTLQHYTYSQAVWDSLQRGDDFAFDDDGLAAVLADVRRRWRGESTAFLTGWEAGGHTVWALAFRHPERWRGVAPVSTNYQRRGLGPASFSSAPARARLPIQPFRESVTPGEIADALRYLEQLTASALADARIHGFAPAPVRVVPGAEHGPLAPTVLAWCDSLLHR
jgi:pimeloyl-ACP methyl ester carboxylesterase